MMANCNKKKKNCELTQYTWGTLNPFYGKKITQSATYSKNNSVIGMLASGIREAEKKDTMIGLSELKGIVLRVETTVSASNITDPNSVPALAYASDTNSNMSLPEQPDSFPAYKVLIPEIHPHLKWPCSISNPTQEDKRRIDFFTTFVAKSSETPTASVGQIVLVSYATAQLDGPRYLGPVAQKVTMIENKYDVSAKETHGSSEGSIENPEPGDAIGN